MSRAQQFFSEIFASITSEFDFEYTRGNFDFPVAVSALRNGTSFTFVSTVSGDDFINPNNRRLYLFTDVSINAPGVTLTPQINMIDPVTSNSSVIEIAAAGNTVTFVSLFEFVPRTFTVEMVHSITGDVTYSVGACLIVG